MNSRSDAPSARGGPSIQSIVMGVSFGMSAVMLAGKLTAYAVSGSTAILSDAAESVIHGVATGFAAYSLWYSQRPADREHTYGHGKIAYFSAGFEGALIFCAGAYIIYTAVLDLIRGPELKDLGLGILITAGLCFINLLLGLALVIVGRRTNTLILVANGKHVLTDMWTSLGVVLGVTIVWWTGILWLDPAVAILVGANIGWTAFGLLRRSWRGLLDEAHPESVRQVLECLDEAKTEGRISGYHQLRLRNANDLVWVEVHVQLPAEMTVRDAHARASAVEDAVRGRFKKHAVYITTHIEPDPHKVGHPEGHPGINDPFAPPR